MEQQTLSLPTYVTSRTDVGRLYREVVALDDFLTQAAIRQPGTPVTLPKTSKFLDTFMSQNSLNALHENDRKKMLDFMKQAHTTAPVIHMSFGADPSAVFIQKITAWLRQNIHPLTVVQTGLQPNIGAGCIVRTTNKHFDFSLREHFRRQRPLLVEKLHALTPSIEPAAAEVPSEADAAATVLTNVESA